MKNNLRIVLAKKKMKSSDLAKVTGLSRTTIAALYYERAKGIQFKTLEKICKTLDCTVGELFEVDSKKGNIA